MLMMFPRDCRCRTGTCEPAAGPADTGGVCCVAGDPGESSTGSPASDAAGAIQQHEGFHESPALDDDRHTSMLAPGHTNIMMLDAIVAKVRTTLTIDEDVLKWVKIRAARIGLSDSAVIEASLRRDLKLDVLDELWSTATLSEAKASELALEAQHATRPRRRGSGARRR